MESAGGQLDAVSEERLNAVAEANSDACKSPSPISEIPESNTVLPLMSKTSKGGPPGDMSNVRSARQPSKVILQLDSERHVMV
jgi:hypothetical protein